MSDSKLNEVNTLANTFLKFDANHVIYIVLFIVLLGSGYFSFVIISNNTDALKELKRSCNSCDRCEKIQLKVAEKVGLTVKDMYDVYKK